MARFGVSPGLQVSVVCGDHDRAHDICDALNASGLIARTADFTSPSDVILFDLPTCTPDLVREMALYAQETATDRPLIASLGRFADANETEPTVDVRLSADAALALAPVRFDFARRAFARRAEAELRRQSYLRYGVSNPPECKPPSHDILYVGDASMTYPALNRIMDADGFTLTAAFSAYSAFDYLHERPFAAIIVDSSVAAIHPDALCAMIRRSPNLINLPMLAIIRDGASIPAGVIENVSDIIESDTPAQAMWRQLSNLITDVGPSNKDFTPPTADITDAATGLFARPFFEDHLNRQVQWSEDFSQPLTLLAVRLIGLDAKSSDGRDIAHLSRVVKTLLRAQDAPTRIDWSTVVISMPGANQQGAFNAAQRISAVLDATAFEGNMDMPARQVTIDWRISELSEGQSANSLLAAALQGGPYQKGHVAA